MRKIYILMMLIVALALASYAVYSASNYDISLNEPAPFPQNM